jgi:hypothetical protein
MTVIVLIYSGFILFFLGTFLIPSDTFYYQGVRNVLLISIDVMEEKSRCFGRVSRQGQTRDWQRIVLQVDRK